MTDYAAYQSIAVDGAGNTVGGASVEVRSEVTGNLVVLFSGRTGGALGNPFTADGDGYFKFHAVGDFMKIRIYTGPSGAPTTERIFRYVPVGLAGGFDIDTLMRLVPAGTVGAPGLAFANEPSTGIYWPSAGIMRMSLGGVQRMSLDSAGVAITGNAVISGNLSSAQITGTLFNCATATPIYRTQDTAGATDQKNWDFFATGGNYTFRANNDANNAFAVFMTLKRGSGNSLGSFEIGTQAVAPLQTLSTAATIGTWNASLGQKAKVILNQAGHTMPAVSNAVEGTTYFLWVIQDGTGSRTITTWSTSGAGGFDFGVVGAPTLTTTANRGDLLTFEAITLNTNLKLRFTGIVRGFS